MMIDEHHLLKYCFWWHFEFSTLEFVVVAFSITKLWLTPVAVKGGFRNITFPPRWILTPKICQFTGFLLIVASRIYPLFVAWSTSVPILAMPRFVKLEFSVQYKHIFKIVWMLAWMFSVNVIPMILISPVGIGGR